ncbi:MAG: carbonic anhydrase [Chloracidobacterium sp.]|nr:carbonic anhydrase [Chloracidobacterium validum]
MFSHHYHFGQRLASVFFAPALALAFVQPVAVAQSPKPARPSPMKPAGNQPAVSVPEQATEEKTWTNEELQADPDMALKVLMEGNGRFAAGKTIHPRQDIARIRETAKGQKPFAIIVGCSDSRVPNEIVFDQGLGDLFIVRTAGQVSTYSSWGSIEFAEEVLGAKLIFVLGHTKCGAVQAAVQVPEVPGHIVTLINDIKPAAQRVKGQPGDEVQNAIRENVRMQVEKLKGLEPVLAKRVREGKLKVVGGVYDIETGLVTLVE